METSTVKQESLQGFSSAPAMRRAAAGLRRHHIYCGGMRQAPFRAMRRV